MEFTGRRTEMLSSKFLKTSSKVLFKVVRVFRPIQWDNGLCGELLYGVREQSDAV